MNTTTGTGSVLIKRKPRRKKPLVNRSVPTNLWVTPVVCPDCQSSFTSFAELSGHYDPASKKGNA